MNQEQKMQAVEQAFTKTLENTPAMRSVLELETGHLVHDQSNTSTKIKVIGIGGAGNDTVNHMTDRDLQGVDFHFISTDAKELRNSLAPTPIHMDDAKVQENRTQIHAAVQDAGVVFVIAGMGGNTGTNIAPAVAACAQEAGALTIGVVMKPFSLEGPSRRKRSEIGIAAVRQHADTVLVVVNDKLMHIVDEDDFMKKAFRIVDDFLFHWLKRISSQFIQNEPS